jgi:hypothetical protein
MRGYLWQSLEEDLYAEFAVLAPPPMEATLLHLEDAGFLVSGNRTAGLRVAQTPEERKKADAERKAKQRAEHVAAGKCARCDEPLAPKSKRHCVKHKEENRSAATRRRAMRERLPDERAGLTHHFSIITKSKDGNGTQEVDGYIQTGTYKNGKLGEVFLKVSLPGDEFVMLDQWSIAISVALQFGAPVDDLFRKFVGQRFWPDGATTNEEIKRCTSPVDYVARWILSKYGAK